MMVRTTQREIKDFWAEEIKTQKQAEKITNAKDFCKIAYSAGTYGLNGIIVLAYGKFWKISSRNTLLFMI